MKRLVVVAALAGALAACGNPAEESDEPAVAETTAAAAAETSAGTYDVTMPDGTKMTSTLNPDGTYQDVDAAGAVSESGTWADREDGKTCFTPASGEPEFCFTLSEPQADGTRKAIPEDGSEPLTIKKMI
jgi:uncharacterized lipoprotein NlpE involved in copper resistance